MSLIGSLNVGKSALAVTQAQLQVTGNNIANAGNADYTRQTAPLSTARDQQIRPGVFMGTGVNLDAITRQIDDALEARLRGSLSDAESADSTTTWLGRVEAVFNELGDHDLSTQLSKFFKSWSDLANKPQDISLRQLVVQTGEQLATQFQLVRGKMNELARDADDKTAALVTDADNLATQVADLNRQIIRAEGGTGGRANGLRDQRDAVLKQLSKLMDVHTIPQENGATNVYAGSEPLVLGTESRGVVLKTTADPVTGRTVKVAAFRANDGTMAIQSGQLGSLLQVSGKLESTNDNLDELAHNLIFELNKLHAGGQGLQYLSDVTGSNAATDPAAVLTTAAAGLKFQPANGTFVVHVRQKATGLEASTLVKVDLDGLNGDDTTLNGLAASLNAVAGISASVVAGKLKVTADSTAVDFSFSQDSSGALAALGMNTFYTGTDARDIAVAAAVKADPRLVAAAKNGQPADNQTALAIAALETKSVGALRGATLKDTYAAAVNTVAVDAAAAKTNAEAAHAVRDTLTAQREALSGVSMDEEAINLVRQQKAFQAASRLISVVNELMDTVMGLVR